MSLKNVSISTIFNATVIVSALGYFVDIYDLILFGIVRVASLKELGVLDSDLLSTGVMLLNMQMIGMLVGGVLWGVLGDKKGRIAVLFGSIFMYSVATFLNAFVTDTTQYAVLRFIAGVGLAGELGAAITLVSEVMSKELRGYGTAIVAGVGVTGAIFAAVIGEMFSWKVAYMIGGGLGMLLLLMRIKMFESGMFEHIKRNETVKKGDFFSLFTSWARFKRFANCVLIGLPIWFVVGVLITFSPEFGKALGYTDPIVAGRAIMFTYTGLIFGDLISGFLSQYFRTRKKIIGSFIIATALVVIVFLFLPVDSSIYFYGLCIALGVAIGYWAVFVTIASEQFGTNIRATVTTTVPNIVRGAVVPITLAFEYLRHYIDKVPAALIVGGVVFAIAWYALHNLSETFGKDLNYVE